jgi:hypothetical protein
MGRWLAVVLSLPSPLVVAFWWFTVENRWVMDRMEVFPLFFAVCFFLGPLAGVGAGLCGRLLYVEGWRAAWYAAPCLAAGATAFVANGLAFVFLIAPGC